jgi:hypothetical protein
LYVDEEIAVAVAEKMENGRYIGDKTGWLNLENRPDSRGENLCIVGYNSKPKIGQGGTVPTIDKRIRVVKDESFESGRIRFEARIDQGGPGRPLLRCPKDSATGMVSVQPSVVGLVVRLHDGVDQRNVFRDPLRKVPTAVSGDVVYDVVTEATYRGDPCS